MPDENILYHPRPQMRRENFTDLNGIWAFEAGNIKTTVNVPYPVESGLSGIGQHFPEGTVLKYSRTLPDIVLKDGSSLLLHIDAVDQEADIYINDTFVTHLITFQGREGIDITSFLSENNLLTICVTDDLNRREYPYGKQTLKRGGMWYTPFSGIWQDVWIEVVPEDFIRTIHITSSLTEAVIDVDGPESGSVIFEGRTVPLENGKAVLAPESPVCWSPYDPKLYEFTVVAGKDCVHSYFALRTLTIQKTNGIPRLCLNGKPFFFHGLLDQGYWPEGICTPPSFDSFEKDIVSMKELGFNTLRKHIKIEPERFYYDCDRLGMAVFQDMINNGKYSFIRDTLLPTLGIRKLNDARINKDSASRRMFIDSMSQTVKMLQNHPCICCWTIFNEGWGQFEADRAYDLLKSLDDTRFIDTASGWFHPKTSDVESLHVYFKKFRMPASEKPVLLSEFGGYSYKVTGHCFNKEKTYGYRFFREQEPYMDALERLYLEQVIPAARAGLSGAIYTQVSDVEDETNGLLTYDRQVCKADKKRMEEIAHLLRK